MKYSKQAGFTLIELLVVIAIIGILSAVVLASLNDARKNARDSAIKQQMKSLVTMMELNYNSTGNYMANEIGWFSSTNPTQKCSGWTFSGPYANDIKKLCQGIENNINKSNTGFFGTNKYMLWGTKQGNGKKYSFMVQLNGGEWFCLGSSGTYTHINAFNALIFGDGCYYNP